jgi:hypothetical protein
MTPLKRPSGVSPSPPARRALLASALTAAVAGGIAASFPGGPEPSPGRPPGKDRCGPSRPGRAVFRARFPADGLITNEFAFRRPDDPRSRTDPDWHVTSGSLFARWSLGWTGVPDDTPPDPGSDYATGSCVFRLVTRRRDFTDAGVTFRALVEPPVSTPGQPERDWDGAHLWMRYRSPQELYALSFRRRDGAVVIKRKAPTRQDPQGPGVYTTLAVADHSLSYGQWHQVGAEVRNTASGRVRISLELNGRPVLATEDTAPGGLLRAGGIGLRGDNTSLVFDSLTVAAPSSVARRTQSAGR